MTAKRGKPMKSKVVNLTAKFRKAVPGLRALAEEDVSPPMPHWDARAPKSTNDPSATASAVNDGNASFGDHVHPRYMQATVDDAEDEEELGGRGGGGGGVNESAASYQVSGHCGPTGAPELNAEQPSSVLDSFMEKHAANSQDHLDWRERPPPEIRQWDIGRRHWSKVTIPQLGYVEHLGHGGAPCSDPRVFKAPRKMVIVHEHGIMDMQVQFCQCATAIEEPYQLIQANLWPATWITPHTVTTIGALRAYEGLSHYANVNVHDYLKHLKNTTNLTFAHTVKDRYREFNMSARQYSHVRQRRYFGLRVAEEKSPKDKAGDMCVLCPACPQPGMNMRPGWQLRDKDYSLKDNKADPDDEGLSEGHGYFANSKDLKTFLKKAPKVKPKFAAMGSGKYKGKVSGVVAITCKHMMMLPGGIVNLVKAEE
ncbi:hypothetical protein TRAPUB_8662 [Trametes pubescens]|uniref:CxC2-like cysteine cluster KDZ transposase-associated domain-containing protein n=1 Tax=Trametes pubescens TaxID=154538 RepID=A0A1M2W4I8_TRAPU|nr:hypothetical protein TRAPUB_8662 [Trametes pubescens]